MMLVYSSVVSFFTSLCLGADILGILPTPSYSHQIAYRQLWRALSLRGHNVTVITPNPVKDPELINLTEIDTGWTYTYFKGISEKAENDDMWNAYQMFTDIELNVSKGVLSSPTVQRLIHYTKRRFDVVLTEFLFPEFLAFGEVYNCPRIVLNSMSACESFHRFLGNPLHPVAHPHFLTPYYPQLNFKERVVSAIFSWYLWCYHTYSYFPRREEVLQEHFNTSISIMELVNSVDLMFVNTNAALQVPRALGPATIDIGDLQRELRAFKISLGTDLKEFLDKADNGFIYFSLGSNVKSKELSRQSLRAIIEALSEIPYKVLWKFESEELPGKPDNVKLVKWSPQQQVLAHPNIKLFVTQGGLQSMEEGIYCEVPFVVIPFFGDQQQNAKLMRNKGIAIIVDRKPVISKTALKDAILEVISNSSYRAAAKKLKELALDTPMTGLEKAVWWTEYVIRHKGAKHLRNPVADLPFYQYYLLDVVGFLFAVAIVTLAAVIVLVNLLYKWLRVKYTLYSQTKLKGQ